MPKGHWEGRNWTEEQQRTLVQMTRAGARPEAIAERVGRSFNAVRVAQKRLGLRLREAPGRPLSGRQIARLMGVEDKTVHAWMDLGALFCDRPYRVGPNVARTTTRAELEEFLEDPDWWHVWDPARITDDELRARLEQLRAGVRWLTPGEAAAHIGINIHTLNRFINEGRVPGARRWGNWRIEQSEAEALRRRQESRGGLVELSAGGAEAWENWQVAEVAAVPRDAEPWRPRPRRHRRGEGEGADCEVPLAAAHHSEEPSEPGAGEGPALRHGSRGPALGGHPAEHRGGRVEARPAPERGPVHDPRLSGNGGARSLSRGGEVRHLRDEDPGPSGAGGPSVVAEPPAETEAARRFRELAAQQDARRAAAAAAAAAPAREGDPVVSEDAAAFEVAAMLPGSDSGPSDREPKSEPGYSAVPRVLEPMADAITAVIARELGPQAAYSTPRAAALTGVLASWDVEPDSDDERELAKQIAGISRFCWLCGCNEDEACEEGCDWANEEKTVCTACVAKEAARVG